MTNRRKISAVLEARSLIKKTISILEEVRDSAAVQDLRKALNGIEKGTPYIRKEAFASVVAMCHPKWLGDEFVPNMEWKEWCSHLSSLEKVCTTAFKKLDLEFTKLSEEQRLQKG